MRILHITHCFHPEGGGGVESYLRELAVAQREAGHDVEVLTGSMELWPECGIERAEVDGVPVRRLHRDDLYFDHYAKAYHPRVEELVEGVLREVRPDVVHVHQWIRLTANLVEIARRAEVPAVVTLHDLYTSCPRAFRVRADGEACFAPLSVASCAGCVPRFGHESEREIVEGIELHRDQFRSELALAAAVLVASDATAGVLVDSGCAPRERIELLPLAYRPRFADPRASRLPAADEPFRFGYWGNLTYRKGAQVLVAAFRRLVDAGLPRPAELHLFGKVDTPALERELRERAGDAPVRFHGRYRYEDLAAAGLHLAVFPMLCFETYGFVLDESFELGLPCIVTDIGAIPVRAGAAAIRVPPKDPSALAAAMADVLRDPLRRDELAAAIVPRSLALDEHVERLDAVYRRAAAGPPPAATPIPAVRRARFLALQRESALARVCPPGGPR